MATVTVATTIMEAAARTKTSWQHTDNNQLIAAAEEAVMYLNNVFKEIKSID